MYGLWFPSEELAEPAEGGDGGPPGIPLKGADDKWILLGENWYR